MARLIVVMALAGLAVHFWQPTVTMFRDSEALFWAVLVGAAALPFLVFFLHMLGPRRRLR